MPRPEEEVPVTPVILDCNQNFQCFVEASADCKPVKVVHTATVDIFGVKQTTTSFFEIKGIEAGKCNFYLRTEKIDLEFPADTPQEVVNQQKEIYKKLEGRDGTCKFNTNDLTAMLKRWEEGALSADDLKKGECQGTLFEQPSL